MYVKFMKMSPNKWDTERGRFKKSQIKYRDTYFPSHQDEQVEC